MAYSTQTRIQNIISSTRLNLLGDKDRDGSVDSALITQALASAKNLIDPYCRKAGVSQVTIDAWDTSTVPGLIGDINDDLAIYYLAKGSPAMNPNIRDNYIIAIELLKQIATQEILLPNIAPSSSSYASIGVSTAEDLDECRVFHRSEDETTTGTTSEVSDFVTQLIRQGVAISVSPITAIEASDTIEPIYSVMKIYGYESGAPAAVTMISTPTLAVGSVDGQICILQGTNESATITLQDDSALSGSLLRLQYGMNFTLGNNDQIEFRYDIGAGLWLEQGRVDLF